MSGLQENVHRRAGHDCHREDGEPYAKGHEANLMPLSCDRGFSLPRQAAQEIDEGGAFSFGIVAESLGGELAHVFP